MRRTSPTQNRKRRQSAVSVSLFPFLAVLICTMGALILLLVVITHQARLQAAQLAAAEETKRATALKESKEDVQWRIELLKESREKTEAELAEARLTLGHVEDHARRLQNQLARLEATLAELDRAGVDDRHQRARLEDELQRVRAEIAAAEQELADARRDAEHRARSYAIVPYHGPNETRRRPIYIECTADAVILQPEGIVLTDDDFDGPMGPGNPLAAALRAEREYLLEKQSFDPNVAGEPYPLLLVRPEGIVAYYVARSAMKSWGSEFGYEMIGDDWKLKFQQPDPELAEVVRRAIETARRRQDRLAVAAPRHYSNATHTRYRASRTRGGIVPEGGVLGAAGTASPSRSSGSFERRFGTPGGDETAENARGGSGGAGGNGFGGNGSGGSGTGRAGVGGPGTGGQGVGGQGADGPGGGSASAMPGFGGAGVPGSSGGGSAFGGAGTPGSALDEMQQAGTGSTQFGPADSGSEGSGSGSPGGNGAAGGQAPGEGSCPSHGQGGAEPHHDQGQSANASAGGHMQMGSGGRRVESLANSRGENWGLPDATRGSVPITRPIRVDCHADRLIVVPEQGLTGGKTIMFSGRTEASIDEFVSAVWQYMETWGIAGNGMYWRPVLNVRIGSGAERRFEELRTLLEYSGLNVQRKQ